MMARLSRITPFCRGRNTTPTLAWRCVGQAVTAVKPISTRAVQRGHKPMIRANGPRNSAATMIAATRAGKGRPLAPSEGREAGEGHELLRPVGRNRAAANRRPRSKAPSWLRLSTNSLPI
jgi:hypothetical protein